MVPALLDTGCSSPRSSSPSGRPSSVSGICSARHCKKGYDMQEEDDESKQVSCELRRDPDDGSSFRLMNQVAHNL